MKKLTIALVLAAVLTVTGIAYAVIDPDEPSVKTLPAAEGIAREGDTLTAKDGEWDGATLRYTYRWLRCDDQGAACADITGATAKTYVSAAADIGRKLRVQVTADNSTGSSSAFSPATPKVVARGAEPDIHPAGATRLPDGRWSIPATSVAGADRLVVSQVQFSPTVIRSRVPFQARVRVTDTRGYIVRDALVYLTGVPWSRILQPAEVKTGLDGWAQFQIQPTARLPLQNGYFLVLFVRARKEGENVLAGVSARRLVQLRTARPAA